MLTLLDIDETMHSKLQERAIISLGSYTFIKKQQAVIILADSSVFT